MRKDAWWQFQMAPLSIGAFLAAIVRVFEAHAGGGVFYGAARARIMVWAAFGRGWSWRYSSRPVLDSAGGRIRHADCPPLVPRPRGATVIGHCRHFYIVDKEWCGGHEMFEQAMKNLLEMVRRARRATSLTSGRFDRVGRQRPLMTTSTRSHVAIAR